jgi:hypothetical protein
MTGLWTIIETTEYSAWHDSLTAKQQKAISKRREVLRRIGPNASRPLVDSLTGSRIKNLKELRVSSGGALRILFVFDRKRQAVLLLGGDKSVDAKWTSWYASAIREAEEIYERYTKEEEEK